MHIIATVRQPSNQIGGIEKTLLDTLRGLSDRGHRITLVYCHSGNQLAAYEQFCEQTIQVHSFRINPKFFQDVLKISVRPDSLVYCNEYADLFFCFAIALLRRKPLIAHHHLPASTERQLLSRWKMALALGWVNRHIAVSEAVKQDWLKTWRIKNQIEVIYNGVDPDIFTPTTNPSALKEQFGIPNSQRVISYVGRLEAYKGLDSLIQGFNLLLRSGVQAKLLIAGKSVVYGKQYEQSLKDLVNQLGIAEHVTFVGHSPTPQLIYGLSDVTVVPSLWLEAFGRVVIESMACGTPVIASRVGGIPEILTGCFQDCLFEHGDDYGLFQVLKQLLDWKDTHPELGQQCRNHILSKFNLEQMIDEVETVLFKTSKIKNNRSGYKLADYMKSV